MSIRDCITSAVEDGTRTPRRPPPSRRTGTLVPSDHPAHHGVAEALSGALRPVLKLVLLPRQGTSQRRQAALARDHRPAHHSDAEAG